MIIFECDICKMQFKRKYHSSKAPLLITDLCIGTDHFDICYKCADELRNKCSKSRSKYNIGDIVIDRRTGYECEIKMIRSDGFNGYWYTMVNCSDNSKRYIDVSECNLTTNKELDDEKVSETITHEKSSPYYIKDKEGLYYITRKIKPGPRSKDKELKYEVENSDTHEKIIVKQSDMISAVL